MKTWNDYILGDMVARYVKEDKSSTIGLVIIPINKLSKVCDKPFQVDSLVQLKLLGDHYPGAFAHGHSMRNSETVDKLVFQEQYEMKDEVSQSIITVWKTPSLCRVVHHLVYQLSYNVLESFVTLTHEGEQPITIEMLSSFSLTGITPFSVDDASETLILHRILSSWSAEGRLVSDSLTKLNFEPAWAPFGTRALRFGQVGSLPAREYFPTAFIEDINAGVTWGVQIAHPSSWQIEISRKDKALNISGGLADREFGHWMKNLAPQETFRSPTSYLTCVVGDVDCAAERLVSIQNKALNRLPSIEEQLPIIFNEYCTTWGNPTEESLYSITESIKDKGITYLVIDSGWYKNERTNWYNSMGDWELNKSAFPNGLQKTTSHIRQAGMIPGIWFEMEVCGAESTAFHRVEHLLSRDGHPITVGIRRFWDFRDPYVIQYLKEKVINFIKINDFGYLKVDYNDSLGIGCDGSESLGEGLRLQLMAVQSFFMLIQQEIPHLVIENCASGGHRIEPSMLAISSMSSFSDAHENKEIPILVANLHRLMLPRQCQIWAVIRKEDSIQRIVYSLSSTMLGRMCLSGDVHDLSTKQWEKVEEGIAFYNRVSTLIKNGSTRKIGPTISSYSKPNGWQAVIRISQDELSYLVIVHVFEKIEDDINISLPTSTNSKILSHFSDNNTKLELKQNQLTINFSHSFSSICMLLSTV